MTAPSAQDVDAAVRSVLIDLFQAPRFNESARSHEEEVFAGRLLSLRHAELLPAGLREVRIAPGTVVTPLARDFLKRLGVTLRLVGRAELGRAGGLGEWGFAIEARSGVVEAFRRSLLDGSDEWFELGASGDSAARWVSEATSRGALVLTNEASVAVYRACRIAGVRAATTEDAAATARAVRALGVNLLVVEPLGKSIAMLKQIGSTFRSAGAPVVPDWIEHSREGRPS